MKTILSVPVSIVGAAGVRESRHEACAGKRIGHKEAHLGRVVTIGSWQHGRRLGNPGLAGRFFWPALTTLKPFLNRNGRVTGKGGELPRRSPCTGENGLVWQVEMGEKLVCPPACFSCSMTSAGAKAAHVPAGLTHRTLCVSDALRGDIEVKPGSFAYALRGGAILVFFMPNATLTRAVGWVSDSVTQHLPP